MTVFTLDALNCAFHFDLNVNRILSVGNNISYTLQNTTTSIIEANGTFSSSNTNILSSSISSGDYTLTMVYSGVSDTNFTGIDYISYEIEGTQVDE